MDSLCAYPPKAELGTSGGFTWKTVESKVKRLQMRIAEAADFVEEHGCFNDAKCS
jgi:hypothetical protein